MTSELSLEAINICKQFGELTALDEVSLQVRKNTIHALLGENGAGKSTLVKCIMGYYHPDSGEILVHNQQQIINNPKQALSLGIGMVYQHFTLIPNMTVAENLVLARPVLPAIINWEFEISELEKKLANMPFEISLTANVNSLVAGEKQKVEIVKQLLLNTNILILDEPTSVLTPNEAKEVLSQIQQLTRTRDLSVIIITHKFSEVMDFADDVTVLRKGQYAGKTTVNNTNSQALAEMMMGQEVKTIPLQRDQIKGGDEILSADALVVADGDGGTSIDQLSFTVKSGEILGIAGVSGNGQKKLVEALSGQVKPDAGEIKVHQQAYLSTRQQMKKHKFHCLPEEPLINACVPNMSVAENIALRNYDSSEFTRFKWLLKKSTFHQHAQKLINRFSIKTPNSSNPIQNLSGGNVQRTVLARELSDDVKVLVVANPCFGLDFNAVSDIHRLIMQARNRGAAVLLISEDLDEIIEMSDRIAVISKGKLVYETTPDKVNLNVIGQYMGGH